MVADETKLAEMKRVRAVTEDIEYVKKEKRDVRSVRDIPSVTVRWARILDLCRKRTGAVAGFLVGQLPEWRITPYGRKTKEEEEKTGGGKIGTKNVKREKKEG